MENAKENTIKPTKNVLVVEDAKRVQPGYVYEIALLGDFKAIFV